MQSRLPNLKSL